MPDVEIYTWKDCPFSIRAKKLLDSKGIDYTEHKIDGDDAARDAMAVRTGGPRSVPQIFIDDQYVGDCSEIHEKDKTGELDRLLGIS